jgi:eukaryotic-like serine/threonine-protein kinase
MSYCYLPHCQNRVQDHGQNRVQDRDQNLQNPDTAAVCQTCGTPLLLNGRYRLIEPLCQRRFAATELFRIIDDQNPDLPLVLKTLISEESKVQELFAREQQLLGAVNHGGIPRGHDAFSVTLENRKIIHCLVMDYIPGENLEQWVERHGPIGQSQAIDWLKQLLDTLDYIHQKNVFHRDIKPSNIMLKPDGKLVLIDFGSIRQITPTADTGTSVVSWGYTAPEQMAGRAVPQSDFYALGRTLMYLLMGANSNQLSFIPKQPISTGLAKLLGDLVADRAADRPSSVRAIRRRLRTIEQADGRRRWRQIGMGFGVGALCGGTVMIPLMRQIHWEMELDRLFPRSACDQAFHDAISCGEESLFQETTLEILLGKGVAGQASEVKREGMQHLAKREWSQAQQSLQIVWEQTKDPEALIYLHNAKIQADPKLQQRQATIAIVAPLSSGTTAGARGLNILRGVAQAQDQAIRAGVGLLVVLVDDQNDARRATQLAKELVRRRDILAVIGHHTSDATRTALKVYDPAGMVLISPTSTSEELASYTLKTDHIFFRTVSSDRATATFMASFLLNRTQARKVAVFYNPHKSYSRSLAGAFKETFQALQGGIVNDDGGRFDISCSGALCKRPGFDVIAATRYARQQGAEAFVVVPDAAESESDAFNNALDIVKSAGQTWVISGDSMAGEAELIKDGGQRDRAVNRTVIAAPWDPNQAGAAQLGQFWQSNATPRAYQQPSWHAYTTYNAAQMLIAAIQQSPGRPDRQTLRARLAAPGFAAVDGSGQMLRFRDGTGELEKPQITLTRLVLCGEQVSFRALEQPDCP